MSLTVFHAKMSRTRRDEVPSNSRQQQRRVRPSQFVNICLVWRNSKVHSVEDGLVFKDGSKLDADLIITCTGFETDFRKEAARIVGQDNADQMDEMYGMDAEGELPFRLAREYGAVARGEESVFPDAARVERRVGGMAAILSGLGHKKVAVVQRGRSRL